MLTKMIDFSSFLRKSRIFYWIHRCFSTYKRITTQPNKLSKSWKYHKPQVCFTILLSLLLLSLLLLFVCVCVRVCTHTLACACKVVPRELVCVLLDLSIVVLVRRWLKCQCYWSQTLLLLWWKAVSYLWAAARISPPCSSLWTLTLLTVWDSLHRLLCHLQR